MDLLPALVAPDSFKGTFTAAEVAAAIARGLREGGQPADELPVADGGEGTLGVLVGARGGGLGYDRRRRRRDRGAARRTRGAAGTGPGLRRAYAVGTRRAGVRAPEG